ncbi:MAG: 50S ribosomal protein L5 [Chloroflexi bacterium]|nr:MAG: 50S ribosomal protein L5 [Chloroflexota bacterium]
MVTEVAVPTLKQKYRDEVVAVLQREFNYANPMQVPTLTKVSVNIGLGEALTNGRAVESAVSDLQTITGQKPVVNRAKKAISNFKLRENNPIGVSMTLRGDRMWEFLDRLMNMALPRVRDFHGVAANAFDGRGNYSLGLTEQIIFPEISFDSVERVRGMQINVITTARNDEEGKRLLELLGMPFTR